MLDKILILFLSIAVTVGQVFDNNYVGVAFSPYTQNFNATYLAPFNSYTIDDIKAMLNLIATNFTKITTYSMGTAEYNWFQPWDERDSNWMIARAAAQINRDAGRPLLNVSQGIYQFESDDIQLSEIAAAFTAAADANSIFPGTVWSLMFTSEYLTDENSGSRILTMLRMFKSPANDRGLKVGIRIANCGLILGPQSLAEIGLYLQLVAIVQMSDYIMCNLYASIYSGLQDQPRISVSDGVAVVGNALLSYAPRFRAINPNIEIMIGETGWPSAGTTFNNVCGSTIISPNTPEKLRQYWDLMGEWAASNRYLVHMFSAFDQPWTRFWRLNDTNECDINGPNGTESHYGLWYR